MERSREELDTRLKQQIQFRIFSGRHILRMQTEKRMTQNIPGIWRLWQYF